MRHPIEFYERALTDADGGAAVVRFAGGTARPLPVRQYLAAVDCDDQDVLDDVVGPVLDVGCGPGRHLNALTARGIEALGVDISAVAVRVAQAGGGRAMVGDVFGEVPEVGRWATALLLDGNIGIGGRPRRLLARLRSLLCDDGVILAELDAPGRHTRQELARLESGGEVSGWFPWASVSVSDIDGLAHLAGLRVERTWACGERWFARLRSASAA